MRIVMLLLASCLVCAALVALAMFAVDGAGPEAQVPIAAPVCHEGPTTAGIDVSYHQERIDWKRVRWAGVAFAFVRISDGTTVIDSRFTDNWTGAKANGILRGAYQYFRPDQDAIAQADIVVEALRADRGELAVAIDVETTGGLPPAKLAARVQIWIDRVRAKLGVEPIIYTGPDFWRTAVGGARFAQPLWLAHYTTGCPNVPAPWTAWRFWQYSDRGRIKGIHGPVDLNVFAGSLEDLRRSPVAFANVP